MSETYILARDHSETQRLNEQHAIFNKTCGYLIHPDIHNSLPLDARIADLGTGTGIWALNAAKALPGASFDAIDISPAQFAAKEIRPRNVRFHTHDVTRPFDSTMHGQFDLVHVRAIVAGMKEADWRLTVANIAQLLKPGGAIQWTEADLANLSILRGSNKPQNCLHLRLLMQTFDAILRQRDLTGPHRLPDLFTRAGFSRVSVDIVSSDRVVDTRADLTWNYARAMLGWAGLAADRVLYIDAKGIRSEIDAGMYFRTDMYTTIGWLDL